MGENKLGFLYKAAAMLGQTKTYDILRSHFLMRCPELRSSKNASTGTVSKERCSYCCLPWKKDAQLKVKTMRLSRRQKKRKKSKKNPVPLNSKQLERICSLCGHTSAVNLIKVNHKIKTDTSSQQPVLKKRVLKKQFTNDEPKVSPLNVYTNTREVFSMKNKNNRITPDSVSIKIKNNKKKKDRFAGLCQKAVLDAAKRKMEVKKEPLNLFLKPSS